MIKPSHYDDDGYPIQWCVPTFPPIRWPPSTVLPSIARAQGAGRPMSTSASQPYDETNIRIRPDKIIADIRASGGRALIAFVGVQSNQFPRAVDLAQPFLAAGLPVAIGGFHISGCLAMLTELPDEIARLQAQGVSRCSPARPRSAGLMKYCAMPMPASSSHSTTT